MGQGLQVWDTSGNLIFDSSTRLTRLIATIATGTSDGSQSFTWPNNAIVGWPVGYTGNGVLPKVTVAGATVNWTFGNSAGADRSSCTILVLGY